MVSSFDYKTFEEDSEGVLSCKNAHSSILASTVTLLASVAYTFLIFQKVGNDNYFFTRLPPFMKVLAGAILFVLLFGSVSQWSSLCMKRVLTIVGKEGSIASSFLGFQFALKTMTLVNVSLTSNRFKNTSYLLYAISVETDLANQEIRFMGIRDESVSQRIFNKIQQNIGSDAGI